MDIKFDVSLYSEVLGTLYKDNEIDLDGLEAKVDLNLDEVNGMAVNFEVGGKSYTDYVEIKDRIARTVQIPFKTSVLKAGNNSFELVATMKNGDVKTSRTYAYQIVKSLENPNAVEADTHYPILIDLINQVSAITANGESGGESSGHTHHNKTVLDGITSSKVNEWNNKADKTHTHSQYLTALPTHNHSYNDLSDKPVIPSTEGLATESYVQEKIAEASLSGGEVDLSAYATKAELNTKADKSHTHNELHSHSNKTVLDGITSSKVNEWNNKSTFNGDYNSLTNKPVIPSTEGLATESYVQAKIAEASLSGGEVDLSDYYTKSEVDNKDQAIDDKITVLSSEMDSVKQSVTNGKTLIASAISDKGVSTSSTDSFQTMANNISSISQVAPTYGEIEVDVKEVRVIEGATGQFKVRLKTEPTVNQTIALYRDNEDITLNQSNLIFTPTNWNVYQTVTFTTAHDDTYDDEVCVVTLSSKSVTSQTVTIVLIDDDIPTINVTGVKLNKSMFTISINDEDTLTATLTPSDATNQNVTWETSNSNCTITPNGLTCQVTGVAKGQCQITVTTEDGNKTAVCDYTIEEIQENTLDIRYLSLKRDEDQLVMPTNLCKIDSANIGDHNDVVHPSVLYFKNGWNGYKYWMAINPYPKTQSGFENPCMIVSNDGDHWETIGDVPIYGIMEGCIHNSDCHIFMENNTMYYLNRGATDGSCMIEYFTSQDGENWSERKKIIDAGEHNYLSPSICKYNGKYYMFVYDHSQTGIDDYSQRITVLESTSIDGPWVKVNTILCPNIPTIWHLEVKIIRGGFIGLILSGSATGGNLYLVKFDSPFDPEVTDYVTSAIATPRGIACESVLYKSTLVEKDGKIELFINSKSKGTLDAFCHWTLNRGYLEWVEISNNESDFTHEKTIDSSEFVNIVASKHLGVMIDYYNYEVEFKINNPSEAHIALSTWNNGTTDFMYLGRSKTECVFAYSRSGQLRKKIPVIFKITPDSIFKFRRDNGECSLFVNDRLVGTIDEKEFASLTPNYYKKAFGVCASYLTSSTRPATVEDITYCKVKLRVTEMIDLEKANEELQEQITNYQNNPSQYYLFDDFNRANGTLATSTNGLAYETASTLPTITSNMLKCNGGQTALVDIGGSDFTIYGDLRPGMNGHLVYLKYVDVNNFIACSFGNNKLGVVFKINGTETRNNYAIFNANSEKYLVKIIVKNNTVAVWCNNQLILSDIVIDQLTSTKIGIGAWLANCCFDTIIVKKV